MEGNEVVSVIEEHINTLPKDKQMTALLAISTTTIHRFATSPFEMIGAIDAMKQAVYAFEREKKEE